MLLNTYKHHYTETHFILSISVPMSKHRSIYVVYIIVWKVSLFAVFLVRIFPHPDKVGRNTEFLSICTPNAKKYRQEKLQIRIFFTKCMWPVFHFQLHFHWRQLCNFIKTDALVFWTTLRISPIVFGWRGWRRQIVFKSHKFSLSVLLSFCLIFY